MSATLTERVHDVQWHLSHLVLQRRASRTAPMCDSTSHVGRPRRAVVAVHATGSWSCCGTPTINSQETTTFECARCMAGSWWDDLRITCDHCGHSHPSMIGAVLNAMWLTRDGHR